MNRYLNQWPAWLARNQLWLAPLALLLLHPGALGGPFHWAVLNNLSNTHRHLVLGLAVVAVLGLFAAVPSTAEVNPQRELFPSRSMTTPSSTWRHAVGLALAGWAILAWCLTLRAPSLVLFAWPSLLWLAAPGLKHQPLRTGALLLTGCCALVFLMARTVAGLLLMPLEPFGKHYEFVLQARAIAGMPWIGSATKTLVLPARSGVTPWPMSLGQAYGVLPLLVVIAGTLAGLVLVGEWAYRRSVDFPRTSRWVRALAAMHIVAGALYAAWVVGLLRIPLGPGLAPWVQHAAWWPLTGAMALGCWRLRANGGQGLVVRQPGATLPQQWKWWWALVLAVVMAVGHIGWIAAPWRLSALPPAVATPGSEFA